MGDSDSLWRDFVGAGAHKSCSRLRRRAFTRNYPEAEARCVDSHRRAFASRGLYLEARYGFLRRSRLRWRTRAPMIVRRISTSLSSPSSCYGHARKSKKYKRYGRRFWHVNEHGKRPVRLKWICWR